MKKTVSFILRISITLGLLIFLFARTDTRQLLTVVKQADGRYLAAAFFLFFLLNVLVFLRWLILLRGRRVKVNPLRLFLSYLVSLFFNLIFPSTIGGDTVRTLDIAKHTGTPSSSILATVVLDRVSGFFGLVTVLVFSLFFGYKVFNDPSILWATGLLLLLVLLFSAVMFSGRCFGLCVKWLPSGSRVRAYLQKIHQETKAYRGRQSALWSAWFLSCLTHVGLAFVYAWVARALGLEIRLVYFLIFVPMISVFSSLPFSVGGLGLRDTASVFVFAKIGVAKESAFAMSLANFGFMLVLGILGILSYVLILYRRRV
ncbi:MAG: lysylphosphatidylglycerol synthase transmembrane domain-containing protein [Candidatus Omnitrophota bacterium]